jgi:hypothetical protein
MLTRRHRERLEEFDNAKDGVPDYKGGELGGAVDGAPVPEEGAGAAADEQAATELKGAALDDALEAAGLSKSGTADEKRARLAEHRGEA